MSTIKDLARHTNLSIATVSKYLNGGNVLPGNRESLERAVKDLNYRMNHIARGLKTRRTMTVGVLIPRFDNYFYSNMVSVIETSLSRKGYSAITCAYHDEVRMEHEKLEFLLNKSVDGMIFVPMGAMSGRAAVLNRPPVPMVMLDRIYDGIKCDRVLSDNRGAIFQALEHLKGLGHRRIGIILGPEGVYTADERFRAFMDAVTEYGLDPDPELVRRGDYRTVSGSDCVNGFLSMDKRPTALIVTNCEMTVGAIVALETAGVRVPEQLSLIGFDNRELALAVRPRLSMVAQNIAGMGESAVSLLLERIEGKNSGAYADVVFDVSLEINSSTGIARG